MATDILGARRRLQTFVASRAALGIIGRTNPTLEAIPGQGRGGGKEE
jgi:hypothetical protein